MKGYKGFYPGMVCIPNGNKIHKKEYKENTVYEEDKAVCCSSGMHFCKYPLDVFAYYPPSSSEGLSEYAEVEALDESVTDDNEKFCSKKLKIGAKIGIPALVQASVEYIKENINKTKIEKIQATAQRQVLMVKIVLHLHLVLRAKRKALWVATLSLPNGAKMRRVTDNLRPLNVIKWTVKL